MKKSTIDSEFRFEKKTEPNEIEVIMLSIKSEKNIESLNFRIPRLKYLQYVAVKESATLTLADKQLIEIFESLIRSFFNSIEVEESIEHNLFTLKNTIKNFLRLAEKERTWDENKVKGFYAELLFLRELLRQSDTKSEIVAGWQRPNLANHDFTYASVIHEIKAISLHRDSVRITSENQLAIPNNENLFLEIFRLESLASKSEDSLADLYKSIIEIIDSPLQIDEFKSKCENDKLNYAGPDIHQVPFKFILHEHTTYAVHLDGFPRILPFENNIISKVSYDISLGSINDYKVNQNNYCD